MTASPESVNWIVPHRRLVLRDTVTYRDLVEAWIAALIEGETKLRGWYPGAAIARGCGEVRTWAAGFFADAEDDGVAVARDGESTLVAPQGAYHVRLWKGPLRILLEHAAGIGVVAAPAPAPAAQGTNGTAGTGAAAPDATGTGATGAGGDGAAAAEPPTTEVQHGGPVRLQLSPNGEVLNPDAKLLMGDVVEFPVHELLAASGLADYENLEFNPQGSFLLGTSLKVRGGDESPPASPRLHDNMVAMRFQLLIDFAVGLYYHLDEPVFLNRTSDVVTGRNGGRTVHARGMIYSASFGRPTTQPRQPRAPRRRRGAPPPPPAPEPEPIWRLACNGWGQSNLPFKSGLDKLAPPFAVTGGWTCSPSTIFLAQYMSNETENGQYGNNSVRATRASGSTIAALNRVCDTITPEQLQQRVRVDPAVVSADLEEVRTEVDALYARVRGDATLMHEALAEAQAWPEWASLPASVRRGIESREARPATAIAYMAGRQRNRSVPDAEKETLLRYHRLLVEKAVAFKERLLALIRGTSWARFSQVRPDFATRPVSVVIERLPSDECTRAGCTQRHGLAGLETIDDHLRAKKRNLERVTISESAPLGGVSEVTTDFTDILGDFNVISLNGHEWAICRIFPHDKLADEAAMPFRGFSAAYNPLTGTTYFDEPTRRDTGQLFVCESGDSLLRWTRGALCGAGPHKWRKINGNLLAVAVQGRNTKIGVGQVRSKALLLISFVKSDVIDAMYTQVRKYRPLVIDPVTGGRDAQRVLRDGWPRHYAERALPGPTLVEAGVGFYSHAAVSTAMQDALRAARSAGNTAAAAALGGTGAADSSSTTGECEATCSPAASPAP